MISASNAAPLPNAPIDFKPHIPQRKHPEEPKKKNSSAWREFKVVVNKIYESGAMIIVFTVSAIASYFFIPCLTATFGVAAGTILATKLVVKISGKLNWRSLDKIERWAWNLKEKVPLLRIIWLIATIAIGYLVPPIGIISGGLFGIFHGLIAGAEQRKKVTENTRADLELGAKVEVTQIVCE